jgi:predicted ferric reductase
MSIQKPTTQNKTYSTWQVVVSLLATFFVIGLILIVAMLAMTPVGQSLGSYLRFLFALDSVQIWWYVTRAFRTIHIISLVGYIGVTLHGYFSGTDTALPSMQILYQVSGLAVLFLTVYWLVLLGLRNSEKRRQAEAVLAAKTAQKPHVAIR